MFRLRRWLRLVILVLFRLNPASLFLQGNADPNKRDVSRSEKSYDSSLFKAMIHTTWKRMLLATLLAACGSVLATTSSLVTKKLIGYISISYAWSAADDLGRLELPRPNSIGVGISLAIGLALMRAISSACDNHSFFQSMTAGTSSVQNGKVKS